MHLAQLSVRKRCRNFRSLRTLSLLNLVAQQAEWLTSLRRAVPMTFTAIYLVFCVTRVFRPVIPSRPSPSHLSPGRNMALLLAVHLTQTGLFSFSLLNNGEETSLVFLPRTSLRA